MTFPAVRCCVAVCCVLALATMNRPVLAVESGLQPGEMASAFYVEDVTGPRQGETLCYACAFGTRRVVNIQTNKVTDELARLIRGLEELVDPAGEIGAKTVHAFVVFLTDDPDSASEELEGLAAKHSIKNVPLTIFDDPAGAPPYKLSGDAEVTVMMWDKTQVVANHAFAPGQMNRDAVEAVLTSARQHLTH